MRAIRIRDRELAAYYEVHNGERWYTVSMKTPSDPVIMNEQLRPVKPTSALGRRIIQAVNERWNGKD